MVVTTYRQRQKSVVNEALVPICPSCQQGINHVSRVVLDGAERVVCLLCPNCLTILNVQVVR